MARISWLRNMAYLLRGGEPRDLPRVKHINRGIVKRWTDRDEFLAKVASGRTLAMALPRWYYASALSSLLADGKPERTYAYMPVTNDENVESRMLRFRKAC
jgi:hypothetical protein